jgi:hypothetical protein
MLHLQHGFYNIIFKIKHKLYITSGTKVQEEKLLGSLDLEVGPIRCLETSVKDYHTTLRNIPKERISHQHRDGSLKSRICEIGFIIKN